MRRSSALSIVGSRIMRLLMALLVAGARGDKQGWVPTCDSNASAPFHYDFVEVGTNDFDTLIELARDCTRGLSVDAMVRCANDRRSIRTTIYVVPRSTRFDSRPESQQFYLDRLPNPPHVTKRNAAIMDPPPADGNVNFFYIDYADLVAHNLTSTCADQAVLLRLYSGYNSRGCQRSPHASDRLTTSHRAQRQRSDRPARAMVLHRVAQAWAQPPDEE